jgi:F420-non-reducing hydrogenase small subunit
MSERPKIAFYWCASCGGCEESVVDLAEDILGVLDAVDIVFWPVAMDFKKSDVESMEDGSILVTLINGAVRTSEQEEMARLLRRKSRIVIAYGSCAHLGGIPSLANQFGRDEILDFVYRDAPTVVNPDDIRPLTACAENGRTVTLPQFRNLVRTLDQVIDVDYYLPGCAPAPALLKAALQTLLEGNAPEKGSVLAPDTALCDACPRRETKPENIEYTRFKRPHTTAVDPELCFLAQEIFCMGPATRGGCGAGCINGNMPCTGCYGPASRVRDQGGKILSSVCSAVGGLEAADIDAVLDGIPDPLGTFYRYGLAGSLLRRRVSL